MRDLLLLLYCTVIGFVAAGITASFFKMITSKPPSFALLGDSYLGAAITMAFCAVTGPAIIIDMALTGKLPRVNTAAWLSGCAIIIPLWSACSGVLLVELIYFATGMT